MWLGMKFEVIGVRPLEPLAGWIGAWCLEPPGAKSDTGIEDELVEG
jgi:hypothetical protein